MDVLRLFRPGIIRSLKEPTSLNIYEMFKNHLKTSVRTIRKHALFSTINIVGLAISMSVGILMILFLTEIFSFDDFHTHKDRIYRVTTEAKQPGRELHFATSSYYIGNELKEQVSNVEEVLVLREDLYADLKVNEKVISITGFYSTASFFDVFSFNLIEGNRNTALASAGGIVLTASTSKKLFGNDDPLGQLITVGDNENFQTGVVTGIIEDPPINSHLQFEALVSMKTFETSPIEHRRNAKNNQRAISDYHVYLLLKNGAEVADIESIMVEMMAESNAKWPQSSLTHFLQPMKTFVTDGDTYVREPGPSFSRRLIYIMIGLTAIVLLSACFNYTNLSLARALRRSKEIGIRKVTGANRSQVFSQFMVEAMLLTLLALIMSIGFFYLIRPGFLNLPNPSANGYEMFLLDISPLKLLYFVLFAIGIACIAGFLPALFLSKLKARIAFADASQIKLILGISSRRALGILQFALSIGLIMCAVFVHKQYQFTLNYDLGFSTENILHVNIEGDNLALLEHEYSQLPEVIQTSRSSEILGVAKADAGVVISEDRNDTTSVLLNKIDNNYLELHELELLAGSDFQSALGKNESIKQIIVNEELLKSLNLGSPEEAIGKRVLFRSSDYKNVGLNIIGVVKDFTSHTLTEEYSKSFAFIQIRHDQRQRSSKERFLGWNSEILSIKTESDDLLATIDKLENVYREIDPIHPFEIRFYDDEIAETYEEYRASYTVISFLAFLATSISTLGLLGMVIFSTESRMKEISIRKVLGAGMRNITLLLSRSFFAMIIIAGFIAIPIGNYLVDNALLVDFIYRAKFTLIDTVSGLLLVLAIGLITIGLQVRSVAQRNPSDILRDE